MPPVTLRAALRAAEARLCAAGCATPALDARVLLGSVLALTAVDLVLRQDSPLSAEQGATYRRLFERRAAGEPVAYLTGRREFFGLDLRVTPDVLIPRPETELLVERAIAALPAQATAVDVGTGSGAIALAVAQSRPDLHLVAVDRSRRACLVAQENVRHLHLQATVGVVCTDLLAAVHGPVQGILANLPYLQSDELSELAPEVQREPQQALDGGPDGLAVYRRLFADLRVRRPPPFLVCCEIAPTQVRAMLRLVAAALPGHRVHVYPDLAGHARVLEARLEAVPGD